jgi:hypothetical protein
MATTVRSILAMILENNMQMDDVIDFTLSPETEEHLGTVRDIQFVSIETYNVEGRPYKTLNMVFDLNDVTEE